VFLRSLTIRGFKSFADKTTLEFTPGISVIVGPNGSGKSNIADAIAWVLGEQGPRALRGAQMADVIFAGSPNRPALGMAEVAMVIDNTAGLIPVPASEIEISRTIYRSGESEYRLGGRPCRLMDIQELLSDTGVGRTLHTIIGQGHLEDVLTARPEERRLYVEEAAGIAKHRRRRDRARSRLHGLEADLLRLHDLLAELRRQLKPLKQQADLAQRHEDLTAQAEELATKLAAAGLRDLLSDRERRGPAWARAEARQAQARSRLRKLDEEIEGLEVKRAGAAAEAAALEAEQDEAAGAKSVAEAELRRGLKEEGAVRERLAGAATGSGRLLALEEQLAGVDAALQNVLASLAVRGPELDRAEGAFGAAQQARAHGEDERRMFLEREAARRAEAEGLRHALASHDADRDATRGRLEDVASKLAAAMERSEALEAEIERLDETEAPLTAEEAALHAERVALSDRVASLEAEEKGLLAQLKITEARRAELSESPGASFLRRRGDHAIGLLRELVEAPPDLRTALRAALGSFADAVVYTGAEEALRDAAPGGGGGVVLAIDGVGAHQMPTVEVGQERRLLDHVRVDSRCRRLAHRLLGNVVVVTNLAEAAARHRVRPSLTFATLDGTVLGPGFLRTPADHDARLDDVRREGASIERELAALRRALREARSRLAEIGRRGDELRRELERLDGLITRAAEEMAGVQAEVVSFGREQQMLAERQAMIDASAQSASVRLSEMPSWETSVHPLPPVPEPPIQLRVEMESLGREQARLEAEAARLRGEIDALAADDPIALRGLLQEAEANRGAAEETLGMLEERYARVSIASRAAAESLRMVTMGLDEANKAWREASAELERIREEHELEDRAREDLDRRINDMERTLTEGHGVDPEAAVASLGPDETIEDLRRRSDLVARRLGLLGRVNLLASGELESLQERHDFLARELEDVRSARRDLERVIEDVDRQMAHLFDAAFRDVAREFSALFAHLFPGGEGRLTLVDPTDPLTSGIEVEARPGRKKVKRLSLLSGGERSLAALAFLFAIFRARPSPFYLMDEVEAALDDVNLHRFLEIVRQFARDSQILVVTHQKRTMETADVLYGVSMGRDGASAVISQRLGELEEVAEVEA
jgi:chromosome segregation protein